MTHLKELRQSFGKTQAEIADLIGITRAAYTNIENKKREPDIGTLMKLAGYYHVTIDYLLGLTDKKENPLTEIDDETLDRDLIELLADLTPEELEKVDAFAQGMKAARKV